MSKIIASGTFSLHGGCRMARRAIPVSELGGSASALVDLTVTDRDHPTTRLRHPVTIVSCLDEPISLFLPTLRMPQSCSPRQYEKEDSKVCNEQESAPKLSKDHHLRISIFVYVEESYDGQK